MPYFRVDFRDEKDNTQVDFVRASGVPQVLAHMKRRGIPKKARGKNPAQVLLVWQQVESFTAVEPQEEEFM